LTGHPPDAENAIAMRLEGSPQAAANARRALGRLRADLDAPLMETMRLLVTELVSNSVRHARARAVALRVVVANGAVHVEVADEGPGFVPGRHRAQQEEAGWGLFLVERMADRWGVVRDGRRTKVWFELRRA
jgi:anti-sigma regulatory factor (Ser/Thr protein kinase)